MCHIKDDASPDRVADLINELWSPPSNRRFWADADDVVNRCGDEQRLISEDGYPEHLHVLFSLKQPLAIGLFEDLMGKTTKHLRNAWNALGVSLLTEDAGAAQVAYDLQMSIEYNLLNAVADLSQLREEVMHILLDNLFAALHRQKSADAHHADDFSPTAKVDLPITMTGWIDRLKTDAEAVAETLILGIDAWNEYIAHDDDYLIPDYQGLMRATGTIEGSTSLFRENVNDVLDPASGSIMCSHCNNPADYVHLSDGVEWFGLCEESWIDNAVDFRSRDSMMFDEDCNRPIFWMKIVRELPEGRYVSP